MPSAGGLTSYSPDIPTEDRFLSPCCRRCFYRIWGPSTCTGCSGWEMECSSMSIGASVPSPCRFAFVVSRKSRSLLSPRAEVQRNLVADSGNDRVPALSVLFCPPLRTGFPPYLGNEVGGKGANTARNHPHFGTITVPFRANRMSYSTKVVHNW